LPVNQDREERAFFKVIDYLKSQREEAVGIQGFTHSVSRPTAFRGYWWSEEQKKWLSDSIVLCFIDDKLGIDEKVLSAKVKELKQTIRRWYRYYGSPQEEVWVVVQQIVRQD
jgi:hypothetical protein